MVSKRQESVSPMRSRNNGFDTDRKKTNLRKEALTKSRIQNISVKDSLKNIPSKVADSLSSSMEESNQRSVNH